MLQINHTKVISASASHLPQLSTLMAVLHWLTILAACLDCSFIRADEQADLFRQQVEPLLRKHCYACHSHAAKKMESGLALDWRSGWEKGGERGPAVVPGQPEQSLLVKAVEHADDQLKMPEEKLSSSDIALLVRWIQAGAWDDRVATPVDQALDWWSLRPLASPQIPQTSSAHPIDAFIEHKLSATGLTFAPPAEPAELLRRVTFDLTGLPPSFDDVQAFAAAPSQANYEALVDRLLASDHYGERWARHWFDTIHFAESHGYEHDVGRDHAWPYRDYVIQAFNNDLPWSDFIRQQLAVDVFSPQDTQLLPALGFLGAGTFDLSTYSTGPVTFDYLDRDDMLTQTMAAFNSTTANCARCHAHKFDPITQEDYYALQAVFAGVLKGDVRYDADAATAARRRELAALLDASARRDASVLFGSTASTLVQTWLDQRSSEATWQPLQFDSFTSSDGATLTLQADGTLLASGRSPEVDTYTLTGRSSLARATALRVDVLPHESLPMQGPGRCQNGNLHLSEIAFTLFNKDAKQGTVIELAHATADFNQAAWGIERAIDGDNKTAWGIHPEVAKPHYAVFEFKQPIDIAPGACITISLRQLHGGSHLIGRCRISLTDAPVQSARAVPQDVSAVLAVPADGRSHEQQLTLAAHALTQNATALLARLPEPARVFAVGTSVEIPAGNGKYQAGAIAATKPVHVLQRGEIDKPRELVEPGALSALDHLPARFTSVSAQPERARRAALADWLADRNNPLTWRSAVNRVWHYHFGRGLCDTPSDFGRMGGMPSHVELLDWLAVWFRDTAGGSLKPLHRLIVTSRTYQQSSHVRSPAQSIDTDNRLLWRQNARRLDADAFRDFVLVTSGTIDWQMGGPSVQHFLQSPGPQATPKLDYASFDWTQGPAHRRSIYRYVWRGIPDPLMAALDFPDLGLLAPVRSQSVSPLQALALYNNPFVLVQSRAMAEGLSSQSKDTSQLVRAAIRRAWLREPTADELTLFSEFVDQQNPAALCRVLINSNEFLFLP